MGDQVIAPIRPEEIASAKGRYLPPEVLKVFNELIAMNFSSGSATVKQDDAVSRIAEALGITRNEVYKRKLVDVEDVYRAAGWKVTYDKPDYTQDYDATFEFSKR